MLPPEAALALVPAYALADRFAGGGWPALDAKLPGRGLFWAALVCTAAGYLVGGWQLALLGVLWGLYRSPPWKVFGGSTTPRTGGEIAGTFARHILPVIGAGIGFLQFGENWLGLVAAFLAYAVVSTLLAIAYARSVDQGRDVNAQIELARGAAFGAAVAGWVLL